MIYEYDVFFAIRKDLTESMEDMRLSLLKGVSDATTHGWQVVAVSYPLILVKREIDPETMRPF